MVKLSQSYLKQELKTHSKPLTKANKAHEAKESKAHEKAEVQGMNALRKKLSPKKK